MYETGLETLKSQSIMTTFITNQLQLLPPLIKVRSIVLRNGIYLKRSCHICSSASVSAPLRPTPKPSPFATDIPRPRPRHRYLSTSTSVSTSSSDPSPQDAEFYDIVIAGGGLVGTALAVALGQLGRLSNKRILMLETADKFWTKPPEDSAEFSNRVVALSPGSKSFLTKLGIWNDIWRVQPVSSLQVWDALSDAHISFNHPDYDKSVAYIVENAVLAHAISQRLNEVSSNVTVKFGSGLKTCKVPALDKPYEKALVTLNNDQLLTTDLLIGADGFNSKVRTAIKSPYVGFNYERTAVVATLRLNEPIQNHIAWQRFLPTGGPIALLPLSSEFSSLVWSTTPDYAKTLLKMTPDEFLDAVNTAFWKEYKKSELVRKATAFVKSLKLGNPGPRIFPPSLSEVVASSRASFPLGFGHSSYYVSRRTALIGDAAHRVHPLAGQGLNLGIGDVECMQRVLNDIVGIGGDIGNLDLIREYETERQRHNLSIQGGIDILHRLYSYEFEPIVALRSIGLSLVGSSDVLKKFIMSQAAA